MIDNNINYIVSGLERSGTSLMMQVLEKAGIPVAFDNSRTADQHNPRGYYELAGGKIINRLMDGVFDFGLYRGHVVKVTAYGLKFLPAGNYRIIYMMRHIDEILDSMQKMGADVDREKDRTLFRKLNQISLGLMQSRDDIGHITVNYRDIIDNPHNELTRIGRFIDTEFDLDGAVKVIDLRLYRNRAAE